MAVKKVAFLGPLGTYSHLVAEKYFGRQVKLVPCSTILDVCSFVAGSRTRSGMIPIENSSGGAIYETVDILLENKPRITIEHEVSLDVRLALLGKPGETVQIEDLAPGGQTAYYRDEDGVHHVPKRTVDEVLMEL